MRISTWCVGWILGCSLVGTLSTRGGDWPQWGYDASRRNSSPEQLPADLHLQWVRELPSPSPAWPASQPELRFDVSYSPVAAEGLLFVPSMVSDRLTAYDAATGNEVWRFYADGPVRFAPIADQGKIYFASDDGCLYCLDARQGTLVWRCQAGPPHPRRILGNERLISTWPVRGGPVLQDGTIYFTAGIWPFMGVFVYAVDATTGRAVWTNSGEGADFILQPHHSPAFSGSAPSGYLAAGRDVLMVPGGRSQPACYDLKTGALRYFEFGTEIGAKLGNPGGYHVAVHEPWYLSAGYMFATADGHMLLKTASKVFDERLLYGVDRKSVVAEGLQPKLSPKPAMATEEPAATKSAAKGQKGKKGGQKKQAAEKGAAAPVQDNPVLEESWRVAASDDLPKELFLKSGSSLVFGDKGRVVIAAVPARGESLKIVWKGTFEGDPWTMLVADGRLFVVTTAGRIYCFGAPAGEPKMYALGKPQANSPAGPKAAAPLLAQTGVKDGYGVIFGLDDTALAEQLLRTSELRLIAVDPDAQKVQAARQSMDDAGLYGGRFAAHVGDPMSFNLPPYLASLIVVRHANATPADRGVALVKAVFATLRPYGGVAVFEGLAAATLDPWVKAAGLASAKVEGDAKASRLTRVGALPGAADWTHQYADATNSVVSRDQLVRAPLGLLWFGGPSNDDVLPRHGHGPSPQVAGGRLFIEGPDMLRATDAYTGRLLWQTALPGLGKFFNSTDHQPGANQIGSNYVSTAEHVYVVRGRSIVVFDAANGEVQNQFKAPVGSDGKSRYWGFLAAADDMLIATCTPEEYTAASPELAVLDRATGQLLWKRDAKFGFRHNAIAAGSGKVFCIDAPSPADRKKGGRAPAGQPSDQSPRLLALDARTGREIWFAAQDVFGTFLNYSQEHDVVLQSGSASTDRAKDEADKGMVAYRGADGGVLWKDLQRPVKGPCMLHHDTIISQGPAYSLLTGERTLREDPLTGLKEVEWQLVRNYGCNTAVASEHLLTFRSAAAGYYDLEHNGGTGNLGGFKSSCTSNLIVADGLLNAPEYTRTCTCRYPNQTSLAMVHDPDAEMWTFNAIESKGETVRRAGINFGAPGDRLADDGTLWMDYPSVGGPSPDLPVEVQPKDVQYFRHHSSLIQAAKDSPGLSWVAASGVRNVRTVTLSLAKGQTQLRRYTVRLHFAEVEQAAPGQRVFRVQLQGSNANAEIDIAKEAGPMTALVKEFHDVEVTDQLKLSLEPCSGSSLPPVLCGIEVVAEGW